MKMKFSSSSKPTVGIRLGVSRGCWPSRQMSRASAATSDSSLTRLTIVRSGHWWCIPGSPRVRGPSDHGAHGDIEVLLVLLLGGEDIVDLGDAPGPRAPQLAAESVVGGEPLHGLEHLPLGRLGGADAGVHVIPDRPYHPNHPPPTTARCLLS